MTTTQFSTSGLERLRRVMAGYVERGEIPGLVAAVSRGEETHIEAFGSLAFDAEPVRRDAIFRISSMTKPIVAVAAMILVEECVLRLDDPVDRLLPELADRTVLRRVDGPLDDTVPAQRPITLRDLLTFRLGFGLLMESPDTHPILARANELQIGLGPPAPAHMPGPDEWLRRLGSLPLMYQPGDRWLYNTGLDILGVLVARAAGRPLADFLQERIFAPLGMVDTSFFVPPDKLSRFATSYMTDFTSGELNVYDAPDGQWSAPPSFPLGGSGLVSTAADFLAFGRMMLNHGRYDGGRILSRASIEVMTTDHLTPAQKAVSGLNPGDFDAMGWGFGVGMITRRDHVGLSVGAYGWDGGLGTSWRADPAEGLTGVLLTQRAWDAPGLPLVQQDFWTTTYAALND